MENAELVGENVVQDFLADGGRLFRRREGVRTITVAYQRGDGVIRYGATIHKKVAASDCFRRRPHNRTAVVRCLKNPVVVVDEGGKVPETESRLRVCVYERGCRTKPEQDDG